MLCPYCQTPLPVDSNTSSVTCPKCGSEFIMRIVYKRDTDKYVAWLMEIGDNENSIDR
jgi:predicted RNA-binding Zn-ribbon protein involved in translation (DUF1610 family)